jgi:uncharacterized protein (TIGR01777 family)
MKCIISGGRGFIGSRLSTSLLRHGHQVAIWSRTLDGENAFQWDPMAGEPSQASLSGVDVVIHLAGEPVAQRWTDDAKRRIRDSRVLGTRRLVEAISKLRQKPAVLVCASAVGFYGSRGDEQLIESAAPGSGFLADICQEWEHGAEAAAKLGLRVVKIRTGIALGRDGGALAAMLPVFRFFAGGSFGSGRQWMPWIHVDDLVEMFRFAIENPISGALNGTAPNPVTNSQFTVELAHALHRPAFLRIPAFALETLLGEMSVAVLGSQRAYPAAAQALGFNWRYAELGEALRNLLNS